MIYSNLDDFNVIFIIGAPRSGTNILRDSLLKVEGTASWDCDEINSIWRYKNLHLNDDLKPENITPKIRSYIVNKFYELKDKNKSYFIIEKTCANTLRINFLLELFPNSKFIVLERNPLDVISSTMIQWKSKTNLIYLLKKLRYVPLSSIFFFLKNFLLNLYNKSSSKGRNKFWGPINKVIINSSLNDPLYKLCTVQYLQCVKAYRKDLKNKKNNIINIRYEELTKNPTKILSDIFQFAGFNKVDDNYLKIISKGINKNSVNKYKKNLNLLTIKKINNILISNDEPI